MVLGLLRRRLGPAGHVCGLLRSASHDAGIGAQGVGPGDCVQGLGLLKATRFLGISRITHYSRFHVLSIIRI